MKLVHLISLGCPKNRVDSEQILGVLGNAGYAITSAPDQAEVIMINTCGFINPAVKESLDTIMEMARYKQEGRCRLLVVTGCLPQRYRGELSAEVPEVDLWLGINSPQAILEALEQSSRGLVERSFSPQIQGNYPRLITTPAASAYLKIAEGCNHSCSFCMIPAIRGRLASKAPAALLQEAEELAAAGIKELILVAQDSGSYGRDLPDRPSLAQLLEQLCAVEGIRWLRLLYLHPASITADLVAVIKRQPKVCHYLDIPFQHASPKVLQAMGRKGDLWAYLGLLNELRREIPDLALRATLMTGFPGEGEAEFKELLTFVELAQLDRLGVFPYYREEGSRSAALDDPVSFFTKRRRARAILRRQREISRRLNEGLVGRELPVLIDDQIGAGVYRGRSYREAPEIDPQIIVYHGSRLECGSFTTVKFTRAYSLDMAGVTAD